MGMNNVIKINYSGNVIEFREDGWFNATVAAAQFGKRPIDWIRLPDTQKYLVALKEVLGISEKISLIRSKKNSGTWLHPDFAVPFARWLGIKFSIWCDQQIKNLLRGTHPCLDWKKLRHEAASSHKVMNAVMLLQRQLQGKETQSHHYSNEARLINWALTREFKALDRNALSKPELDLLTKLEERNTVLIGCNLNYDERKLALERFSESYRQPKPLESAA